MEATLLHPARGSEEHPNLTKRRSADDWKPHVIALYSPVMQSGKSTVSKMFTEHGFEPLAFAQPLKRMVSALLDSAGYTPDEIDWMIFGGGKDNQYGDPLRTSPRHMMQTLGTDWGRQMIHENLWVDVTRARLARYVRHDADVVIDDCRFPNEAEMILGDDRWKGSVIQVVRPGLAATLNHASEGALNGFPFTTTIVNDGSMFDLREKVQEIVRGLKNREDAA